MMIYKSIFLICLFVFTCRCDDTRDFKNTKDHVVTNFKKPENETKFEEFTFVQAADPQFGLVKFWQTMKPDGSGEQDNWDVEKASLAAAVKEWNDLKPKPEFVVINGDLANAFPNTNQTDFRVKQLKDLKAELNKLDKSIPLILMPGNHDIFDTPTAESIKKYNDEFGDDYFVFYVKNVMFIVPNTEYFYNSSLNIKAAEEQDKWLDERLNEAKNGNFSHVISLQHYPFYIEKIDEPTDTNNSWRRIPAEKAKSVLDKYSDSKVDYVFAGHYHQNVDNQKKYNDTVNMVITSALGWQADKNTKPGYRIVKVTAKDVQSKYKTIGKDDAEKPNSASTIVSTTTFLLLSVFIMFFY